MMSLETAIRLIIIGQELLIALIFLAGKGNSGARLSGALFLLGVAGYLATSSLPLQAPLAAVMPLVTLLTVALPYSLWLFAKSLFDSPMPPIWLTVPFVGIGVAVWLVFNAGERVPQSLFETAFIVSRIASLVIVLNALWMSATGKRDDLLERRRWFRSVFVTLVSIQVTAVLIVELLLGTEVPPAWLSMLNVVLIGIMTMGVSIPLLRLRRDFFPDAIVAPVSEPAGTVHALGAADRVLYDKLMRAMDGGAFRQSALTIGALAGDLAYPEHQLRRLINQHLGFRNFSAFLNSYRIEDAKARLGDPEQAKTPVLTIALDLGYGSLGPFNRAFKETTGMTPTAWREQNIPANFE